ncbi:MAG TPA: hypothetical protein VKC55_08750, partial [Actinomycetota bacterium]|nr:hypothetical protein [Actinomycetota bacterium]
GALVESRAAITQTQDIMAESRDAFDQGVTALAKLVRSDSETSPARSWPTRTSPNRRFGR